MAPLSSFALAALVGSASGFLPATTPSFSAVRRIARMSAPAPSADAADAAAADVAARRQAKKDSKFVSAEMRPTAMKLHTRSQAPKEGQKEETKEAPMMKWEPTREGYLQFLVDSRHVYTALEEICASRPELEPFRDTGLERVAALNTDIEDMASGAIPAGSDPIPVPDVGEPGSTYAAFLRDMADGEGKLAPEFICHYYNFYFAHSAGGRMIGRKMSEMLLDGHELEFYQWKDDVKEVLLPAVADDIDKYVLENWTREQKDMCLGETAKSFQMGGALLSHIK